MKYWLPYFFLWTFCYLFYPCWLVSGSPLRRYTVLLSFLLYLGALSILYLKKVDVPDGGKCLPITLLKQRDLAFIGAAIVFVLLHIYPIAFLPLRTWSDEPSHASSGIQILEAASPGLVYSTSKFEMLQWFSRLIVLAGILIAAKYKPWKYFEKLSAKRGLFLLGSIVVLLSHLAFLLLKDAPFYDFLYKPPALSRWLSLVITTLAEQNVFWVRLPSLLFCLLSSALIYEIVALLGHKDLARIAAVVFLFSPNVSYFSSHASPGCGTVFFSLLPLYFLIYFLESKNYRALHWCFFWAAAGSLWKRPVVTAEIYLIVILALYHIFVERVSLRKGFTYWLFSLGMISPFFLLAQFATSAPEVNKLQEFISFSPLFSPRQLGAYLGSFPRQISFVGLVLFCVGLLFFLTRRRYVCQLWPLLITFLCWYTVLTMALGMPPHPQPRWQLPLYPFIAVCLAVCFRFLMTKRRKIGMTVFCGYLSFMILCCTFLHFPRLYEEYALYRTDSESPGELGAFLPYENMILYMKKHLPPGSKVIADDFPDPREFYSFKHHINVEWKLVKSKNELLPGIEGLYEKANSEGASYLFLPESVFSLHIDKSAVDAVFEGDTIYFSRMKVFLGPAGRVGLFTVKGRTPP